MTEPCHRSEPIKPLENCLINAKSSIYYVLTSNILYILVVLMAFTVKNQFLKNIFENEMNEMSENVRLYLVN